MNKEKDKNGQSPDMLRIKVSKDGPYFVQGKIPLTEQIITTGADGIPYEWNTGKKYEMKEQCSLCRCGHSESKPFCDGTHLKINFDGRETAIDEPYVNMAEVSEGPALKLTDAAELCASARFCHRAGEIWNLIPKSGDEESKRVAIEEAGDCPSGRLVVWDKKTGKAFEPSFEPSIGFVEDPQLECSGPIWVRGRIPVESGEGKTYEVRNRVTLCRCGKSSNKPFCDSSHFPEHRYEELIANKQVQR